MLKNRLFKSLALVAFMFIMLAPAMASAAASVVMTGTTTASKPLTDFVLQNTANGKVFYLDAANGSDSYTGKSPDRAFKTLTVAKAAMTSGQWDTLYIIGGATALGLSSGFTWDKNYCQVIGICPPIYVSQRARINNGTTNTIATLFTISGTNNVFKNIQWFQGGSANTALGCVKVTGIRNYFENCHFAGGGHATPAGTALMYSLYLYGAEECVFKECTIGLDTIDRAYANSELLLGNSATRNLFEDCIFESQSDTAGHFLVAEDGASSVDRYIIYKRCIFYNFSVNHATSLTSAFSIPASYQTHDHILQGCTLVGVSDWDANSRGCVWSADPVPTAGTSGVAVKCTP